MAPHALAAARGICGIYWNTRVPEPKVPELAESLVTVHTSSLILRVRDRSLSFAIRRGVLPLCYRDIRANQVFCVKGGITPLYFNNARPRNTSPTCSGQSFIPDPAFNPSPRDVKIP